MENNIVELQSEGARLIATERLRQITDERWTPTHDDDHGAGELAGAAIAYVHLSLGMSPQSVMRFHWPWEKEWLKPSHDPIRNLVKAGALIAAEIDRLTRLKGNKAQ